jgi:hypothetical protein
VVHGSRHDLQAGGVEVLCVFSVYGCVCSVSWMCAARCISPT